MACLDAAMRMARAGCTREVFASDAIVLLHEATAGAMRDLDRLINQAASDPITRAAS
jgi:general secretion pathway protein A